MLPEDHEMAADEDSSQTATLSSKHQQAEQNVNTDAHRNNKRKRRPAGTPDPDAEVVALSPRTLLESDRYICDICSQGFQRDQNLQMHRRRHKVPWKLLKKPSTDTKKRVYVCPESTCLHHDPSHALGDLVGIKKHYRRKHSTDKQWHCEKCSKGYAVQSDYKAHLKTCGTRGHCCDCGKVFSRVESFIEHQDACHAAREKSALKIGLAKGQENSPCQKPVHTTTVGTVPAEAMNEQPALALSNAVAVRSGDFSGLLVSRSSPASKQRYWTVIGDSDSRELQLMPEGEETGGSRENTQFVLSCTSGTTRTSPTIDLASDNQPCREGAGESKSAGGEESAPRLHLSIGPSSMNRDGSGSEDNSSLLMMRLPLDNCIEKKFASVSDLKQQHRSDERRNNGKVSILSLDGLESLSSAGAEGSLYYRGDSGCGESLGEGLTLAGLEGVTISSFTTPDSIQVHDQVDGLSPRKSLKHIPNGLQYASAEQINRHSHRTASPIASQHHDQHYDRTSYSDVMIVRTSSDCTSASGLGKWQQPNIPVAPSTPSTGNDPGIAYNKMPSRIHKYGSTGRRGDSTWEQSNLALIPNEMLTHTQNEANQPEDRRIHPDIGRAWSDFEAARRTKEQARVEREEAESQLARAELLKQEAREQMMLASVEKTYAQHTRQNAKRQRELAESEWNSAKRAREQAHSEIVRVQLLKEQAARFIDVASSGISVAAAHDLNRFSNTDITTSSDSFQDDQHFRNESYVSSSSNNRRQVPPVLNFSSLSIPIFSSSSTSMTSPRYSTSSMIPLTHLGATTYPPSLTLSSVRDVLHADSSSAHGTSTLQERQLQLRTPKPEFI